MIFVIFSVCFNFYITKVSFVDCKFNCLSSRVISFTFYSYSCFASIYIVCAGFDCVINIFCKFNTIYSYFNIWNDGFSSVCIRTTNNFNFNICISDVLVCYSSFFTCINRITSDCIVLICNVGFLQCSYNCRTNGNSFSIFCCIC